MNGIGKTDIGQPVNPIGVVSIQFDSTKRLYFYEPVGNNNDKYLS